MRIEQTERNHMGWVDTWEQQENELLRAAEDVKEFFNDPGLVVSQHCLEDFFFRPRTVDVRPACFQAAPSAIQRVFLDLGISERDAFSLEFGLPLKGTGFNFSITPEEVTDKRFGIKLSTIKVDPFGKEQGQVITPKGKMELNIAEYAGRRDGDKKLARIGSTYNRISREYEVEDKKMITHPFKLKIMVGAAQWGKNIMESRRVAERANATVAEEQPQDYHEGETGLSIEETSPGLYELRSIPKKNQ